MKPWYESKTIWVNVLTVVIVLVTSMMSWPDMQQYGAQLTTMLAVVNVILRLITSEGISDGTQQDD
jgi:uncharacterized membrane protein